MSEHATGFDKGYGEAAGPRDAEIAKLREALAAEKEWAEKIVENAALLQRAYEKRCQAAEQQRDTALAENAQLRETLRRIVGTQGCGYSTDQIRSIARRGLGEESKG